MKHTRYPQCGTSRDIESPLLPPATLVVVVLILVFLGSLAGYPPSETAALLTVTATVWYLATNATVWRHLPLA